ncbi:MAG: glycosyltransferase family 39 protein [Chloroflexi bacterium]|nr:glycosyltransferase family 39 protein [Chloroflexota bacterium]
MVAVDRTTVVDRAETSEEHLVKQVPRSRVLTVAADMAVPLATFVVASLALLIGAAIIGASPHVAGEVEVPNYVVRSQLSQWEETFLAPWQHWDGLWYLKIAAQGYDYWDHSLAFFPFYPLVVRIVGSLLHGNYLMAAVVVSVASYLVALVYLYKLARQEFDEGIARRSIIYLAIFPTAFFFMAVYTESLFLALTVAAFYYARRKRWVLVGILGMVASLTRSTGLLLVIPLLVEYLQQRQFNLREVRADILSILVVPAGTALYVVYNLLSFGRPTAFLEAQDHWERALAVPWQALLDSWALATTDPFVPLVTPNDGSILYQVLYLSNQPSGHVYNLVFFALGFALMLIALKTLRPVYGLYALLSLALPLFDPSGMAPLLSMPRFVLVVFPLFFVLARLGRNRVANWTIVVACLVGLFFLLVRFASWYWVA